MYNFRYTFLAVFDWLRVIVVDSRTEVATQIENVNGQISLFCFYIDFQNLCVFAWALGARRALTTVAFLGIFAMYLFN
jgi:hypothetical protein